MNIDSLLNFEHRTPISAILNPTDSQSITSSTATSPNISSISSTPTTPTHISNLSTLTLPPTLTPSSTCTESTELTAKKRELRMVGQRHRDKEKTQINVLYETIHELQNENHHLFNLCTNAITHPTQVSSDKLRAILKSQLQQIHGTHRVSDLTAAQLGVRYLSGAMALLLLETIACRRNIIVINRIGRQRNADLVCAKSSVFDTIIASGVSQLRREATLPLCEALLVIGVIHANWARTEAMVERFDKYHLTSLYPRHRSYSRSLQGITKPSITTHHRHLANGLCRSINTEFSDIDEMEMNKPNKKLRLVF